MVVLRDNSGTQKTKTPALQGFQKNLVARRGIEPLFRE